MYNIDIAIFKAEKIHIVPLMGCI